MIESIRKQIDDLQCQRNQVIVAIDGSCTSGKTTLATRLAEIYDCNVFHMDDFFLRPEQRTQERYAEVGGNVDYERFREEVLLPLKKGRAFAYRPFSCKTFTLDEPVQVAPKMLNTSSPGVMTARMAMSIASLPPTVTITSFFGSEVR